MFNFEIIIIEFKDMINLGRSFIEENVGWELRFRAPSSSTVLTSSTSPSLPLLVSIPVPGCAMHKSNVIKSRLLKLLSVNLADKTIFLLVEDIDRGNATFDAYCYLGRGEGEIWHVSDQ